MLIRRGWNIHTDAVRNELETNHPAIKIIDVPFFNIDVFNRCENGEEIFVSLDDDDEAYDDIADRFDDILSEEIDYDE